MTLESDEIAAGINKSQFSHEFDAKGKYCLHELHKGLFIDILFFFICKPLQLNPCYLHKPWNKPLHFVFCLKPGATNCFLFSTVSVVVENMNRNRGCSVGGWHKHPYGEM